MAAVSTSTLLWANICFQVKLDREEPKGKSQYHKWLKTVPARRPRGARESFLMKMLAAVFAFQAILFSFAVIKCSQYGPDKVGQACPELGRRFDQTFGVMIATILALLGTSKSEDQP